MSLISLKSVSLSYGAPALLDGIDLDIGPGERVCLLGRNGAGKSTLLRIIDGQIQPDSGEVRSPQGVRIGRLAQEAPAGGDETVLDVVAGGLGHLGALVGEYYRLSHGLAAGPDDAPADAPADAATEAALQRLAQIQQRLETEGGWEIEQRAERVVSRLGLDAGAPYATLSGGLRRRVMLARALVTEPDLLLLDEPTNHLDIDTIEWLEEFLLGFRGSLLFITHDRRFLRRLATRILELDRGRLTDWPGDYDNYLRRREERLNAEARERERFDKKLAEEEVWIRQGIKARRTRNEGRVRALKALREERQARREGPGQARIRLDAGERSGKLVIEAEGVAFGWDGKPVIAGLDTLILRGDRVGIIGPNGAGKSTLLKLLLGQLEPDAGRIRRGTNLQIAYFDQLRAQLDPAKSVRDNVAGGSDKVEINGVSKHVLSYLKDFLFTPERARQPVSALSGGERNRLLLARLFTQPANLLVLDEPTNDLDAETLELLEELLQGFPGTLLLVSHDRDLLDNVVTSTLVLEGEGRVGDYVGGYSDWLRQRPAPVAETTARTASRSRPSAPRLSDTKPGAPRPGSPKKLSYKQQRELEQLPQRIEALEAEQEALHLCLADPALYQGDGSEVAAAKARLAEVEGELSAGYARWEALEEAQNQASA
ncbi:ATP-binding cassette domain-containing protein [Thiohalocapsa marina]|uniref:ATP-binding protein Uup n=1 Tax=Thiohalocapsa marina TaxID=424902 RepID=A0A5M8FKR8_9GAMM|nr:ATP-binding cassette domain-containing protein [Thiohalocapsa marina]KAA6185084.1 ATP-binding cassette domain-containing protein [Thiohalocapsa marina]